MRLRSLDGSDSRPSIGDKLCSSGLESSTETALGFVSSSGTGRITSSANGADAEDPSAETILGFASSAGTGRVGACGSGASGGTPGAWKSSCLGLAGVSGCMSRVTSGVWASGCLVSSGTSSCSSPSSIGVRWVRGGWVRGDPSSVCKIDGLPRLVSRLGVRLVSLFLLLLLVPVPLVTSVQVGGLVSGVARSCSLGSFGSLDMRILG
jgi:hypothetical protein